MPDLKKIIDYSKAPLVQWEPVIGEEPSDGKRQEDGMIYPEIITELMRKNAQSITGIIADEGRLELAIAEELTNVKQVTHLTLQGAFEKAARKNIETAAPDIAQKVHVTTDSDDIAPHSQDAVVMSLILGCVAKPGHHQNISKLVTLAKSLLKEDGQLIIVRPNPEGGSFSTYQCTTAQADLKSGDDYDFIVAGLEDAGEMKNLYTPDSFMEAVLTQSGFTMGATKDIHDAPATGNDKAYSKSAPFLLNICKPK